MNPWTKETHLVKDSPLHPSHVRDFLQKQLLQKKTYREANGATEKAKKSYVVRERNYETYNYINGESTENKGEDENDDTLSSILVRAMHRKTKRKEIDQAMKLKKLEEAKRELEEEKRRCENAKRRQGAKLREIREAHKLRLIKEEQWRAREARQAKNNKLADDFQKFRLLRRYFQGFRKIVEISRENKIKARDHYQQRIMQRAFSKLVINREKEQSWKEKMADGFHNVGLLQKFFVVWREEVEIGRAKEDEAREHHRQRILRRCLLRWRSDTLETIIQRRGDIQKASFFYHRTLLRRGLHAWAKYITNKKSRRQRNKVATHLRGLVKDIVPDFSPPTSDDDEDEEEDEENEEELDARLREERWRDIIAIVTEK